MCSHRRQVANGRFRVAVVDGGGAGAAERSGSVQFNHSQAMGFWVPEADEQCRHLVASQWPLNSFFTPVSGGTVASSLECAAWEHRGMRRGGIAKGSPY